MKPVYLSLLLCLAFCNVTFSQTKTFPRKHQLEKAKDYEKYESVFIEAVDYYVTPSEDKTAADQQKTGEFMMTYVTGSPKVTVTIHAYIVEYAEDCPSCLLVFLGGWTKDALQSGVFDDDLKGNMAGIKLMLRYYEANKEALGKNRKLEKLLKKEKKSTLEDFVKGKIQG